ncbi:hypothetical protein Trydic_g17100 [Trypoxylus dichotomus]
MCALIVKYYRTGKSNRQIARELNISSQTKQIGGEEFNDMIVEELNDYIDEQHQASANKKLEDLAKSSSKRVRMRIKVSEEGNGTKIPHILGPAVQRYRI